MHKIIQMAMITQGQGFFLKALILKFNSFWLYEVLFPPCQLKCWEAMFCCLFITHFLNRLCSNPTPLLFLFLDAKAQTDFIHSSLLQSVPISRTRLIFQDVRIFSTLLFEEFLPMLLKTRLTVLFLEGLCGPPILRLYCLLLALVCAPPSLKF